jgi:hypothetical protein
MLRYEPAARSIFRKDYDAAVIDSKEFDYNAAGLPKNVRQLFRRVHAGGKAQDICNVVTFCYRHYVGRHNRRLPDTIKHSAGMQTFRLTKH